jgi:hypothetical protein
MISIGEIQVSSPVGFLQQDANNLLPHATTLVFEQAPMARFRRGSDVVRQVFPLTAGFEHVQDAVENFPFGGPGPSGSGTLGQQGTQIVPLDIRDIGPVRLPDDRKNSM